MSANQSAAHKLFQKHRLRQNHRFGLRETPWHTPPAQRKPSRNQNRVLRKSTRKPIAWVTVEDSDHHGPGSWPSGDQRLGAIRSISVGAWPLASIQSRISSAWLLFIGKFTDAAAEG
jgi:hypothetical protein